MKAIIQIEDSKSASNLKFEHFEGNKTSPSQQEGFFYPF